MHNDIESSLGALETIIVLARNLAAVGITVYRCQYDFSAFGSWTLEAGSPHRRILLTRDGKNRKLEMATGRVQNAGATSTWDSEQELPLEALSTPQDLENLAQTLKHQLVNFAQHRR